MLRMVPLPVPGRIAGARRQRRQSRAAGRLVAAFAHLGEAGDLAGAHLLVVDIERIHRVFAVFAILVDPDDHRLALVHAGLLFRRRAFNRGLGRAGGDIGGHAACCVHIGHHRFGLGH